MKGNARTAANREEPVQRGAREWQAPGGRRQGIKENDMFGDVENNIQNIEALGGGGGRGSGVGKAISNWYIEC